MKGLILVVCICIFLICALVGFQLARNAYESQNGGQDVATSSADGSQAKQYSLIVVHVDRLDSPEPRLMSVWFVSLFFVEGSPPVLTIAPIYPVHSSATAQALERSFSLNQQGEPSQNFWKAIRSEKFKWDAFVVVDDYTVQKVMEWTNGPGNYFPQVLENAPSDPDGSKQVLTQMCRSVGGIASRGEAPFQWSDLVPNHFRSNLRMEEALSNWNKLTTSVLPVDCEVLLK